MLRLMASPGTQASRRHTRGGPTSAGLPSSPRPSKIFATRPPAFSTLARSAGSSGRWSRVSAEADITPFSSLPSTARQSPTHAVVSWRPRRCTAAAAAPLSSQSIALDARSASAPRNADAMADGGSRDSAARVFASSTRRPGRRSRRSRAT